MGEFPGNTVTVLLGNGDGTFQKQGETFTVGTSPDAIAFADLNGNGIPDLITANYGDFTLSVLTGLPDGTFQLGNAYATEALPSGVKAADLTGDGQPDLVVVNYQSNTVNVFLGNGDGTFQPPTTLVDTGRSPYAVQVADLNGDGRPDIIVANRDSDSVGVFLGNGDGTFQPMQSYSVGIGSGPVAVYVADLTGNGIDDIVTADRFSNQVSVLMGNGDGTFQPVQTYSVGMQPHGIYVADVNGDGIPDLIVANQGNLNDESQYPGSVGVLLGNRNGTFQPMQTFLTGGFGAADVAAVDVNGDGRPDLVVVNAFGSGTYTSNYQGTVAVLLNETVKGSARLELPGATDLSCRPIARCAGGDRSHRKRHPGHSRRQSGECRLPRRGYPANTRDLHQRAAGQRRRYFPEPADLPHRRRAE